MLSDAPAPGQRGRKVCIVGFAKTSRDLAPYSAPEWEIWGVNDAWSFAHRADRWFEVHSTWIYEWELRRAKGHLTWLRQFGEAGGIVYLLDARSDMPHAVAYPFAEVCNALWPEREAEGDHKTSRPYLTSSIAYMQALAIAEGFAEIAVVGVDMAADSEYAAQKPCCEYLLGLARGRGIKIWLPESCGLLDGPLYGRGALNEGGERISTEQLSARLKRLEQHELAVVQGCDQALGLCQQIKGAMTNARDMLGEFPDQGPKIKARIDNLEGQLGQAQQSWARHMEALNQVRGALAECRYWIGLTPEGGDARLLPPVLLPPIAPDALVRPGAVYQPGEAASSVSLSGDSIWPRGTGGCSTALGGATLYDAAPPARPAIRELHVCGDGCETPGLHTNGVATDALAVAVPHD